MVGFPREEFAVRDEVEYYVPLPPGRPSRLLEDVMVRTVRYPVPPEQGWSAAEYAELDVPDQRTELIDGNIILNASPRPWHNIVLHNLAGVLKVSAPTEYVVLMEQDVRLDDRTVLCPDVLAVRAETFDIDRAQQPHDEVVLAVEVWSPGNSAEERRTKPERYAAAGIPHFWAVTRVPGTTWAVVATFVLRDGVYVSTGVHGDEFVVAEPWKVDIGLEELTNIHG